MTSFHARRACVALAAFALHLLAATPSTAAAVLSVDRPSTLPDPIVAIPDGSFLVAVRATGAAALQRWQFDLQFDPGVVQAVDTGDGGGGIFGLSFRPGDPSSTSFVLSGFPFNELGLVDDVSGAYPSTLAGVSGEGLLAGFVFRFVTGRETADPGFALAEVGLLETSPVPEPGSLPLMLCGLALTALSVSRARTTRTEPRPSGSPTTVARHLAITTQEQS